MLKDRKKDSEIDTLATQLLNLIGDNSYFDVDDNGSTYVSLDGEFDSTQLYLIADIITRMDDIK